MPRLSEQQADEIAEKLANGAGIRAMAREYGVSHTAIAKLKSAERTKVKLMKHEADALLRLLAEQSAGPGFQQRWRETDVQSVMFALRRIAGVDLVG